jgi:hypothetical protein
MAANELPFNAGDPGGLDIELAGLDEEWATMNGETSGYKRTNVYMRSTDGHGHGTKLNIKFLEQQLSQVSQWVDDPRTKYRSMHDFIRDAVYHRVRDMADIWAGGVTTPEAEAELMLAELETAELDDARREELIANATKRLTREIDNQRWEQVKRLVDNLERIAEDWPMQWAVRARGIVKHGRDALRRAVSGDGE